MDLLCPPPKKNGYRMTGRRHPQARLRLKLSFSPTEATSTGNPQSSCLGHPDTRLRTASRRLLPLDNGSDTAKRASRGARGSRLRMGNKSVTRATDRSLAGLEITRHTGDNETKLAHHSL